MLKTMKGKHFTDLIEDKIGWHGKPMTKNSEVIITELKKMMKNPKITLPTFAPSSPFTWPVTLDNIKFEVTPSYQKTEKISTRVAYGNALLKLGDQDKFNIVVALDADVKNSTFSETLEKAHPNKFINCFIAEQNMVSTALGLSKRNKVPFCSTFGCFFTRAFDQIRMGAISFGNVKYAGSHTGINIGEDGPSQMAMEVCYELLTFI